MFPSYTHTTDLPPTRLGAIAESRAIWRSIGDIGPAVLALDPVKDAELLADVLSSLSRMRSRARRLDRLTGSHGVQHSRQYVT